MTLSVNSTKDLKQNQYQFFVTLPKSERGVTTSQLILWANITMLSKLDKDIIRKRKLKSLSLMNRDVKTLNKILETEASNK